jgi:hypothetical protein
MAPGPAPALQVTEVAAHPFLGPAQTVVEQDEPHGSLASAQDLPTAGAVEVIGRLGPGDGMDMYRIRLTAGTPIMRFSMSMDSPSTASPMQVLVFDGSGREMSSNPVDPKSGQLDLVMRRTDAAQPSVMFIGITSEGQRTQRSAPPFTRVEVHSFGVDIRDQGTQRSASPFLKEGEYRLRIEPGIPVVSRPVTPDRTSLPALAWLGGIDPPALRVVAPSSPAAASVPSPREADAALDRVPASTARSRTMATNPYPFLAPLPIGGVLSLGVDSSPANDQRTEQSTRASTDPAKGEAPPDPGPDDVPDDVLAVANGPGRDPRRMPPGGRHAPDAGDLPPIGRPPVPAPGDDKDQGRDGPAPAPGAPSRNGLLGLGNRSRAAWRLSVRAGTAVVAFLAVGLLLPDLGVDHPTLAFRRPAPLDGRGRRAPRPVHP